MDSINAYTHSPADQILVQGFLNGKSQHTLALFSHFVSEFGKLGSVQLHPTKTMIAIGAPQQRIAWITQLGKNFIHVVFPFNKLYEDNLCFTKVAQVPGSTTQFNHHLRIYQPEDINAEVLSFMKLAYSGRAI